MKTSINVFLTACLSFLGSGLYAMAQTNQLRVLISNHTEYPCLVFTADKPGSQPLSIASTQDSQIVMTPDHEKLYVSTKYGVLQLIYWKPRSEKQYQLDLTDLHQSKDRKVLVASNKDKDATDMLVSINPDGTATLTNRTQSAKDEAILDRAQRSFADALSQSQFRTAEYWLAQGASVNVMNEDGTTPLTRYAQMSPHLIREIISFLLDHDANVNGRDKTGATALECLINQSAWYRSVGGDLIGELLARGADPRIKNAAGISVHDFLTNPRLCTVRQQDKQILIDRGFGKELGLE